MAKRDFYEVLGRPEGIAEGRDQEGVPQARGPVPPRPQPRRPGRRGEVQGGHRGLRDPRRRPQARGLRPVRLRGPQGHGQPVRPGVLDHLPGLRGHLRGLRQLLRLVLRGRRAAAAAPRGRRGRRGADLRYDLEIIVRRRGLRREDRDRLPPGRALRHLQGHGRREGQPGARSARPAAARARSGATRGSSPSPRSARAAAARARSSSGRAPPAAGRAPCAASGRSRSRSPRASRTAGGSRVAGEGDAGPNGAPPGDLYVVIHVQRHEYFERDGTDLYCAIPISITQAALGAEISLPTLDGRDGARHGPAGHPARRDAAPARRGGAARRPRHRGDLYVKVLVRVPETAVAARRRSC